MPWYEIEVTTVTTLAIEAESEFKATAEAINLFPRGGDIAVAGWSKEEGEYLQDMQYRAHHIIFGKGKQ